MVRDCNDCVYITVNETIQKMIKRRTGKVVEHKCRVSGETLRHNGQHPRILMECGCFTEK